MDMHQAKAHLPYLSPLLILALRLQEQQPQVHLLQLLAPFEQWGKERTNSSNRGLLVTLPISANNILIAIVSNTDNNDAIATAVATTYGSSLCIHTWNSSTKDYGNDTVAYIAICI